MIIEFIIDYRYYFLLGFVILFVLLVLIRKQEQSKKAIEDELPNNR